MNSPTRTQVRLPDDIYLWVKERAKREDRSLNAEIIRILREKKESEKSMEVQEAA